MSASTSFKLVQHKSPRCKTNKDRIRCKERKIPSCPLYMYHQACQDSLYRLLTTVLLGMISMSDLAQIYYYVGYASVLRGGSFHDIITKR